MDARASGRGQLLCALAILIALGGTLVLATAGAEEASRSEGRPDERALAGLSLRVEPRVAARVEEIRGLEFDQIPEPEVVDSDYLNRLSAREARRAGAYGSVGADEAELRILGLLDADEQVESIFGSTGDLAAAAYDTHSDRLYVVSDAVAANRGLIEFVLAHELDHALEDQRFGLRDGAHLDDDAALALAALQEGSATALMLEYGSAHLSATDLLAASAGVGSDTGAVPHFYVDQLLWTYLGGNRFVAELRRLGGGWKLVDYALESRPPATSEQVLHIESYVRDEPPLPVRIATTELEGLGWRRVDGGVVGELTTSQLLELGSDRSSAERAASGWGGDRYELWRRDVAPAGCEHPCRSELVLVVDWRSDSVDDARRLQRGVTRYLEAGLDGLSDGGGVWTLEGGAAAMRTGGDQTALVFAPNETTALAVAGEQVAP